MFICYSSLTVNRARVVMVTNHCTNRLTNNSVQAIAIFETHAESSQSPGNIVP